MNDSETPTDPASPTHTELTPEEPKTKNKPATIEPPTTVSKLWVRYVVGFSAGVAIGLSVYLGKLSVPLFSPLLDLIPRTLQDTLIPLSSAFMGTVAVVVQFYASHRPGPRLRSIFVRTATALTIALIALMIVHTLVVVTVETVPGRHASFVVGFSRPERPPCPREVSDAQCIGRLTLDPAMISSFWGDSGLGGIRIAQLALQISYLAATTLFGALVGLVVLTTKKP